MEYLELYHGREIIITTLQQGAGDWRATAELLDSGIRVPLSEEMDKGYRTEDEAREAALSAAAGTIDLTRVSKGKL
jgi:hypothetical protein